MNDVEVYDGTVLEVYSGDDIIAMLDLKVEGLHKKMRLRLSGVDTPNGIGAAADSKAGLIRSDIRRICQNKQIRVTVVAKQGTKWVATVEVHRDGGLFNINEYLINQGYKFKRERTE